VSQARGFLGPGSVQPHIDRALDALTLIPASASRLLDLGSGGGLPGLPLAVARPGGQWTLLDGSVTRCEFLGWAVAELGLEDRVQVVAARAEEAGRGGFRGVFDVVLARSFGPPAVTAECAAPFLATGGVLIVAEPPASRDADRKRWPASELATLGMAPLKYVDSPSAFQVLVQRLPCPDRYPRRVGIPAKRPLF
jgi:16S rRNA (guanine527-N7)-methyltransferase